MSEKENVNSEIARREAQQEEAMLWMRYACSISESATGR